VLTKDSLDYQLGHARARDAVHRNVDFAEIAAQLQPRETILVHSAAPDRTTYLKRPDLGRQLREADRGLLLPTDIDIVFVVADGLSAAAVQERAVPTLVACFEAMKDFSIGPIVLAQQGRVALGDEIGALMRARLCAILIGERPGLTVSDSLGIYLTFDPRPGRTDSERNCISNIHAAGLGDQEAAARLAWLSREALRRRLTGVLLKEESGSSKIGSSAAPLE
jgi:ethanolamine ammonia-lyase small subunit